MALCLDRDRSIGLVLLAAKLTAPAVPGLRALEIQAEMTELASPDVELDATWLCR